MTELLDRLLYLYGKNADDIADLKNVATYLKKDTLKLFRRYRAMTTGMIFGTIICSVWANMKHEDRMDDLQRQIDELKGEQAMQ